MHLASEKQGWKTGFSGYRSGWGGGIRSLCRNSRTSFHGGWTGFPAAVHNSLLLFTALMYLSCCCCCSGRVSWLSWTWHSQSCACLCSLHAGVKAVCLHAAGVCVTLMIKIQTWVRWNLKFEDYVTGWQLLICLQILTFVLPSWFSALFPCTPSLLISFTPSRSLLYHAFYCSSSPLSFLKTSFLFPVSPFVLSLPLDTFIPT